MIFTIPDPIPKTVKDPDDISAFFSKFRIVPWYGFDDVTSHTMLELFQVLTTYSTTFKSVVADLNYYTFGLNANVVGRARPGVSIEPVELSPQQQLEYENWLLEKGITIKSLLKVLKKIDLFKQVCGNAFLVIRRIQVGDTIRYTFKAPHYKHCAYLLPVEKEQAFDFLIISKFLTDINKMQEHPPTILIATQQDEPLIWNQTDDPSVQKAVIHVKKELDDEESDFYSRPEIIAVLDWLYTEIKLGNQNSKVVATDLITKILLAFQAPDPNTLPDDEDWDDEVVELSSNGNIGAKRTKDRFERSMMVLKELTTSMGVHPSMEGQQRSASSITGIEYPFSGVPPTSIPLDLNRDTAHHDWQNRTANSKICEILRWAPELTSARQAETNLGGNLLYDLFTFKNETTIVPRQTEYENFINDLLAQIVIRENGPTEFVGYGLKLMDVITAMIEKFKGASGSTIEMISSGNQSQVNKPKDEPNTDDSE